MGTEVSSPAVHVIVVSIVVGVRVLMKGGFMEVVMVMLLVGQKYRAGDHQRNSEQKQEVERIVEQQKG
jgi:hypothetical protein